MQQACCGGLCDVGRDVGEKQDQTSEDCATADRKTGYPRHATISTLARCFARLLDGLVRATPGYRGSQCVKHQAYGWESVRVSLPIRVCTHQQ
jgi:hypothetical protein